LSLASGVELIRASGAQKKMLSMRHALLFGITFYLWLNCSAALGAQVNSAKQPLVLTVEMIGQQYCTVNPDLAALQMRLRLRYTNVGSQKLILYKGHDLFYQTKIRAVSTDSAKPYEITFLNSRYFDEEPEPIEQPSPSRVFVVLPAGATFERELVIGVLIAGQDAGRGAQAIRDGEHTLQLTVSTWYKSKSLAQKMRQQWERKGLLWFDAVTSRPIRFIAERSQSLVPCR
jgi:hypothetical protein